MKIHRFIGPFDLQRPVVVITDGRLTHQIAKVLRLKAGETVQLCDGSGHEARGTIREVFAHSVEVALVDRWDLAHEPKKSVTLYCAILKRENFEWVVQKATEVGVSVIVPMRTERTVKMQIKQDRLEAIALEAAEQSGRGVVPVIHAPMLFHEAVTDAQKNSANIFFDLRGIVSYSAPLSHAQDTIGLFIGPEGGWTEIEQTSAEYAGFSFASLGALTLRAETAAVVASYLAAQP